MFKFLMLMPFAINAECPTMACCPDMACHGRLPRPQTFEVSGGPETTDSHFGNSTEIVRSEAVETTLKVNIMGMMWLNLFEADSKAGIPEISQAAKGVGVETTLKVNIVGMMWLNLFEADSKAGIHPEISQAAEDFGPASEEFNWMRAPLPPSLEGSRGRVLSFNTSQDVELYWESQQQPGKLGLATPKYLLNRDVQVLSVAEIPWDDVFFTCHTIGIRICHKPLHSQTFALAAVKFVDSGHIGKVVFTDHKMDPLCDSQCDYMHHPIEYGLFRVGNANILV